MRISNKILRLTNMLGLKCAFFFLVFMTAAQGAFAYSFSAVAPSGQTLYYNIVGGNAVVTYPQCYGGVYYYGYSKPNGSLTIPSSVSYGGNTYSVTTISGHAFYTCSGLTTVTIPNTVTTIGDHAFSGCSGLTSVTISNMVTTIGDYAFSGCSGLASVTISNTVTTIGYYAFSGCSGLTSITIPNSVMCIGESAFGNCTGLTTVNFYADSCNYAGGSSSAFFGDTNISTINFGNNVTIIPSYLCSGLGGLSSVTIPNTVTTIGNYAFCNCSGLTSVIIGNSVTTIGHQAFYGCSGLTSVTIPNSVTTVWSEAFFACSGLTSVTIGISADTIGGRAFGNCTGLATVNFNADSCTYAGSNTYPVFAGCTNISTFNFGNNVTKIPSYLCRGLSGLLSVTIPNSVTIIGSDAFVGCSGLTSITIPNSVTIIGSDAFVGCSGLTSITIPNSVMGIGESAFGNCTGLTIVNFNADSCNYAGGSGYTASVFVGDTNISTINFGNNVAIIPSCLCKGLGGLSSVTIPNSVTTIGDYAFYNCSGLTSVTIPNSVTTIGNYAFCNCSGLISVTIPNSVTTIGGGAFRYCNGLTTVYFNADSCIYGGTSSVFAGCTNISTFNFGNNVAIIPSFLCKGLSGLSSITIPNSVTIIGNEAFYDCSGLTSVHIGNSVTSIGGCAFYGCSGLTTVTIPNSVTTISYLAFYACSGLDTVWLLPNVPPSMFEGGLFSFPSTVDCFFVSCDAYNAYVSISILYNRLQIYNWPNLVANVSVDNSIYGTATIIQQSNHDVSCDSLCIISATSNYGYHFDHWSNGRTSNPDTLLIMGDSTIVAYFAPNQYIVEGMSYYSDRGHVSGSDTVNYLDTVVLTATAYYGYMFDHWSDGAYENPHSVVANGDRTIWAYFTPVQLSLSVASADEDMGTVSGGGNYDYHSNRTIRAIANTGYHFTHWNDGDVNNNRTITLTQDTSFIAYFAPNQYTLTLQSADETLGIVNGGGEYNYHDTVIISATAIAPHYHFESWSDDNTDNPRQVVVSGDIALTAYFSINVYDVALEVDSLIHGTVSGDGSYTYGTAATVTATPYSGWQFWHWSDGATYNPYTFAVVQDTVLTAYFVREGSQNDIDSISTPNIKIHAEGQQIMVEGAEGNTVMVYDLYGRVLAIKRDEGTLLRFDVPATGTYLIRIGDAPARRIVVVR